MTIEERVKRISDDYLKIVCPMVMQYEILTNQFPLAILNEIRDIFTHLAKYYTEDDEKTKSIEISRAEGHAIRAKRDAYKFVCIAFEDKYSSFMKSCENVDLSLISDGKFLPKLLSLHDEAIDFLEKARHLELKTTPEDFSLDCAIYETYDAAYVKYNELNDFIKSMNSVIETMKGRIAKKIKKEKLYEILTWVFGVATIVSTVLAVIAIL